MNEFDFIAKHLAPLAGEEGLGLKDDAAVLSVPPGYELVISQDTMVEGVHFPPKEWGAGTAEKLLRVNLSDLAAKGAAPWGYMLSLTLPRAMDEGWLAAFAAGLGQGQDAFGLTLFGGDTTRTDGPLVISATIFGIVPAQEMVGRDGAKIGDTLYVTGTIGDAALGLDLAMGKNVQPRTGKAIMIWEGAYQRPKPQLACSEGLRALASASLDVSDGLIADAAHLARASKIGLEINASKVPFCKPTQDWLAAQDDPLKAFVRLVTAGDDYQILFTAKAGLTHLGDVPVTDVGRAVAGEGVTCLDETGSAIEFFQTGYTHF